MLTRLLQNGKLQQVEKLNHVYRPSGLPSRTIQVVEKEPSRNKHAHVKVQVVEER